MNSKPAGKHVLRALWGEEAMRAAFVSSDWCVLEKADQPERGS
jgi:hypothetical protein